MVHPKSENLLVQWTKLLLALSAQTLALVYYFSATLTKLETDLAWVKSRQMENFSEHTRLSTHLDDLSEKFHEHCLQQEREKGAHTSSGSKE